MKHINCTGATLHASSIKEAISRLWAFLDEQGDELLVQSLQGFHYVVPFQDFCITPQNYPLKIKTRPLN
jgi:hypothetical protein